ncbi:Crp/Fnr family transcriptional regulator [Hyphococcus sp.]|jgi:CRP-like cAMP-binding protein|uniref:Crp/Fnr family transcriptional regulator n=1 Tax=Hyphococcus sp. TaxID=2038636 RepID=UPI003D0AB638
MNVVPIQPAQTDGAQAQGLSKIAPFEDLPDAVLSLLSENSETKSYSAGQTVFSLGQYDGGEFLAVLSGALRISLTDGATGAMLIEEAPEGSVFGLEIAIADPDPSKFQQIAVTAEKDCKLAIIDAAEFKSLAAGRPSLMRNVAIYLAEQLVAQRFRAMCAHAAPEQRVYAVLLECVARDPISGVWRIEKMPKHRELADRAGVDETAAAGAVAALIQDGVAQREYPGLVINDMSRLNRLAS